MPPLDPDVADLAPCDPALTVYDEEQAITYLRMLDADAEGADWRCSETIEPCEFSKRVRSIAIHREPFAAEIVHHGSRRITKPLAEQS